MNEPWWMPSEGTARGVIALFWVLLKFAAAAYVFYRLESIAEAVKACGYEDSEDK